MCFKSSVHGGCIPPGQTPLGQTPSPGQTPPPPRRPLQWTERILLECILVKRGGWFIEVGRWFVKEVDISTERSLKTDVLFGLLREVGGLWREVGGLLKEVDISSECSLNTDMLFGLLREVGGLLRELGGLLRDLGGLLREVGGLSREVGGLWREVDVSCERSLYTNVTCQEKHEACE